MNKYLLFGMMFLMLACGPTVKVRVQGTRDGVNISTTQSASDSTALNIQVNPTLNFK